jgi:hypothetical protein
MTVVVTADESAALDVGVAVDFELDETTGALDEPIIVGKWTPSNDPAAGSSATVEVSAGGATVEITVAGVGASTGDLTVAGDLVVTGELDVERPLIFWQHPRNQTIPNEEWTPLAWNTRRNTIGDGWTDFTSPAPSTTIAAGSDQAELPEATIHVDDASEFAATGYLVIEVDGTDRVVHYTGKTATTFTGSQFGVGTLETGQTVRQALVEFTLPLFVDNGTLCALVAEAAFAADAAGSRGIRVMFQPFGLQGAATLIAAAPDVRTHVEVAEQPAAPPDSTSPHRIDVYQSSGGPLDVDVVALGSPRLVCAVVGSWDGTTQNDTD